MTRQIVVKLPTSLVYAIDVGEKTSVLQLYKYNNDFNIGDKIQFEQINPFIKNLNPIVEIVKLYANNLQKITTNFDKEFDNLMKDNPKVWLITFEKIKSNYGKK